MLFMTSGNKKTAEAAIARIDSGGGTNLSAGLFRGINHHQQAEPVIHDSTLEGKHQAIGSQCSRC